MAPGFYPPSPLSMARVGLQQLPPVRFPGIKLNSEKVSHEKYVTEAVGSDNILHFQAGLCLPYSLSSPLLRLIAFPRTGELHWLAIGGEQSRDTSAANGVARSPSAMR